VARALASLQLTPADELRQLLSESERLVAAIRGRGAQALELLQNLDRIEELWPQLEVAGADLRPEAGRWETLQASVRASAGTLVRELNAGGGLAASRASVHSDGKAAWWWYLDEVVRAQRAKRIRKGVIGVAAVVFVVLAGYFLFTRLFPVDPQVKVSVSAMMSGQQKAGSADLEGALADFQAATQALPDDPEAWAWVGVMQESLGRNQDAEASFARVRELLTDDVAYHSLRSQVYGIVGMNAKAETEALAALAIDPESPEALFYLAGAYENMGQLDQAVKNMELASQYAEARGKNELNVVVRYRLALLMQGFAAMPPPTEPAE